MHLTLFQDAHFDGTYIDFDIVIADSMGVVPQTGMIEGAGNDYTITVYDSAGNADAATIAVTEIGAAGVYKVRTTYADLNRAAGDGIWRWVFGQLRPDITFEPLAVSILINVEIGTATGTPTTAQVDCSGLNDQTLDHYKDSIVRIISGANAGEIKKMTGSSFQTPNIRLTFGAMSAALVAGDKILIINR